MVHYSDNKYFWLIGIYTLSALNRTDCSLKKNCGYSTNYYFKYSQKSNNTSVISRFNPSTSSSAGFNSPPGLEKTYKLLETIFQQMHNEQTKQRKENKTSHGKIMNKKCIKNHVYVRIGYF